MLVDKTKDLKKKKQLLLVLMYYYNGTVHESFLDFKQATELDTMPRELGQGYDGASVMSGRHSGVAAKIKAKNKSGFLCALQRTLS